jgi:hypothetical protein
VTQEEHDQDGRHRRDRGACERGDLHTLNERLASGVD